MPYVTRVTAWFDPNGHPLQVAVAKLEHDTWDVLSEAVEPVGPFQGLDEQTRRADDVALNLAERQLAGQTRLW